MERKRTRILILLLIVSGILIIYIYQMSPAPFLLILGDTYNIINNDALLNLTISIIYPFLIFGSIVGGKIESKLGLWGLFVLSMIFVGVGIVTSFISEVNYIIFIFGRIVFALGMGLSIPFFGAFIMQFFEGEKREAMNMLNALYPFIGTLISFASLPLLYNAFSQSWQIALGIWSAVMVFILVVWIIYVKKDAFLKDIKLPNNQAHEKNIYGNLLKRREIRLLTIIFMVDFFCYAYIAVILPMLLVEAAGMTESLAGFWSAIAFPGVGIMGCVLGGLISSRIGRRKPLLIIGMVFEFVGIFSTILGDGGAVFILVGVALFALGNGLWLPLLYNIPMELKNMNPSRVGAAFAIISASGFACGFISPIVGGWLTNKFVAFSSHTEAALRHVEGLKGSLFIFGFVTLIGVICAFLINETGQNRALKPKINKELTK